MREIVRKTVLYQCSICKTNHTNKRDAQKCESRTLEKKVFAVGDMVSNKEPRICSVRDKHYTFKGRVVRIIGPMASDYEYETKWLGGKTERLNGHVFQYQIEFRCPHCKDTREERYFAPELNKLSR